MDLENLDPNQIKGLISLLQGLLPEENNSKTKSTKKSSVKPRKINARKTSKPSFHNKFDDMSEARMHKEDIAIDRKLAKLPPVPRTRQFNTVDVLCRVCGKKETVNPSLVDSIERYKCNKCCSSGGA
jgi:hypothetical protein